ncbi:MAG: type IV pilus modification PilV family protein [Gemmatimonadaceae bacterium]
MRAQSCRRGFSLLETIVALTLFAGVLLGMLGTGQLILARMYDSDLRFRTSVYARSIVDSLRGTACTRLASGTGASGQLSAAWSILDLLDAAQLDVSVTVPQRGSRPPRALRASTLIHCPEP